MLQPSERLICAIKEFEGFSAEPYQDATGRWTVGYGYAGLDVRPGETICKAEADVMLRSALAELNSRLVGRIHTDVTQGQWDALLDFSYNCGLNALLQSTLFRKLNAGDPTCADEFLRWNHAGGKVLPGLTHRRQQERAWFLELPAIL